jgi:hypothetical protein
MNVNKPKINILQSSLIIIIQLIKQFNHHYFFDIIYRIVLYSIHNKMIFAKLKFKRLNDLNLTTLSLVI